MTRITCLAAAVLVGMGESVSGALILDQSPETIGGTRNGPFVNQSLSQNFGERLSLSQVTSVTGVDIYTRETVHSVGQTVTIRVWSDLAGDPLETLHDFNEPIAAIDRSGVGDAGADIIRVHADVKAPVVLAPGEYWIGMSRHGLDDMGQLTIQGGVGSGLEGSAAVFSTTVFTNHDAIGDSAIRVWGTHSAHDPYVGVLTPSLPVAGATYFENFDSLGPEDDGNVSLPTGWTSSVSHTFHDTTTADFPPFILETAL